MLVGIDEDHVHVVDDRPFRDERLVTARRDVDARDVPDREELGVMLHAPLRSRRDVELDVGNEVLAPAFFKWGLSQNLLVGLQAHRHAGRKPDPRVRDRLPEEVDGHQRVAGAEAGAGDGLDRALRNLLSSVTLPL